jgi:hypothetical protein
MTPLLYDPAAMITKDDGNVETQLFHVAGSMTLQISICICDIEERVNRLSMLHAYDSNNYDPQKVAEYTTLVYSTTNPAIKTPPAKNAHSPIPSPLLLLFHCHTQFHPIIPCLNNFVCLTNPTLLPIIPSPPTPKSSFLGKLNSDSVVNVDRGNACNIDVIGP